MNSDQKIGLKSLTLIFGISSLWDGFTTVYGTTAILERQEVPQMIAGVLLAAIILGLLYNTSTILNLDYDDVVGISLKLLWFCAFAYDLATSYMGNIAFLITSPELNEIQKFVLFGLTFFVTASPILLSLLVNRIRDN